MPCDPSAPDQELREEKKLEKNRIRREYGKNYKKTLRGRIAVMWSGMFRRVSREIPKHGHFGKGICSKSEFIAFAEGSEKLKKLHQEWIDSGCLRGLVPTPDRIDNEKGYTIDNLDFCTAIENSRRYMIGDFQTKNLKEIIRFEREKAVREAFATENAINNENFSPIPPTYFDRAQNAVLESMFLPSNAQ